MRTPISSKQAFIDAVTEMAAEVWDFHVRWNFGGFSAQPIHVLMADRERIMEEEIRELHDALSVNAFQSAATEAADVLFVALGHCQTLNETAGGIGGIRLVTGKNAAKTRKTHAVAPSGKLLPLADELSYKWRGLEDARAQALKKALP